MPRLTLEEQGFKDLLACLKKEQVNVKESRIQRAFEFAKRAHEGQFRMSGVPYICHPVETARILAELKMDEESIIAGILHDVPEDTQYTVKDIEIRFGKQVAKLVFALTKLSKVHYKHSMGERQVQSLRRLFIEIANDPRVVIIKLADRLHNMRTLQYLRPEKQIRIAKETLEIFAPLANLYGIFQLQKPLEDLCFFYLQPDEYARIDAFLHEHESSRKHYIEGTVKFFEKMVKKAGIPAHVEGRPKHLYSIYQKMLHEEKLLQDIYDYFAIRIIVKKKEDCYRVLGLVHSAFKPKPQHFKDYIAVPKLNGYQSLHTTVIGHRGKLNEVQIRTEAMHEQAEYGNASHLLYKEDKSNPFAESLMQLKKASNSEHFIQSLQEDILNKRIYVFTPRGDTINLPEGATCLDYMYAVGLPMEENAFRAVVNHKNYSVVGELETGDNVEIVYLKKLGEGPQRWWLDHVKTTLAKKAIRQYLQNQNPRKNVETGAKLLQQALDHESCGPFYLLPQNLLDRTLEHFDVEHMDQLLSKIGQGDLSAEQIYQFMFPEFEKRWYQRIKHFLFKTEDEDLSYQIRIKVEAYDRTGILREILEPFYKLKIPILSVKTQGCTDSGGLEMRIVKGRMIPHDPKCRGYGIFDLEIRDHSTLITLFDHLEKIPGIYRVQRVFRRKQVAFGVVSLLTLAYFLSYPFLLTAIQKNTGVTNSIWSHVLVYSGVLLVLFLLGWLRSLGRKTFPHFGETTQFWSISFGLTTLAVVSLFVNNAFFDLNLSWVVNLIFSSLVLFSFYLSHRNHEAQKARVFRENLDFNPKKT